MGERATTLAELRRIPLFDECDEGQLARIAKLCEQQNAPPGQVLVREGAVAGAFFLVVDGQAEAVGGGERRAEFGPGDFFGEMGLLDREPRSATVTSCTRMELLVIDASRFRGMLAEVPAVARGIAAGLAGRLRAAD